ncbi:ABC transporter ATP-binding protein [Ethanoligenens harbinense]|uniref:ABC transporter related protein n=1 Tax=Ethanoligenens harbinense (strain DSM 18485 / JCM 12961 / CGMCC 1.5033 / YUAN-3) TaxID=663278 RepID=E6U490_ETHHY|nr:ABC transporter ATP-binding protein [Ethanoligenens harbinense]ADU26590.1 ABC transporter related protein [Ethanoligenens harbinense YUAN-3]AVQ95715.1 ABC transporter ATP-binding protein [Ethanoligenens harbinense YUAN-3]AYF38378.1 ABC transporter ATP-binding protein [Ethanoligenens harbinense]AYF41122.1 ABC transporter ATP-binding protein [Ethanoligenens harbinense]QCN91954.1 ABC transporter ATP-binding protein [Ethanoligenens harbinense]
MRILETQGLYKTYGKGETQVQALRSTNVAVQKGEFIAIIGPSGSGKSTMLHMLGGLDYPSGGKVLIDGTDLFSLKEKELSIFRRRKIGFVFQAFNLVPVLSVVENIELPLLLDRAVPDRAYIDEIIHALGLSDRKNHLPTQLSGGQQQRVAIGRALASKPAIILADEPTGNLDTQNSKEVLALLHMSVQKYHQTLIVITHNPEIAAHADRVLRIEDGVVTELEAGGGHAE